MCNMVYTKFLELPDFNKSEILRYAGGGNDNPAVAKLLDECLAECGDVFKGRICYGTFPVSVNQCVVDLSFAEVQSRSLAKNLKNCDEAVVFAATVGLDVDRMISKYSRIDVSKANFMQAIGTERIEALCDVFCETLRLSQKYSGFFMRPRFSAGYGDLPIDFQRDIISVLDCNRKIGVTLNDNLLMSPSKSVTAIVGFGRGPDAPLKTGCENCDKSDCEFRNV